MTPIKSSLLNSIAEHSARSGVVAKSQDGAVTVEGSKNYGISWLKNIVSSDARKANVELKTNFLSQLKSEFKLSEKNIETITKRMGRMDTPLDLQQAKKIIGQLQTGNKDFMTPSERLKAQTVFANQYMGTGEAKGGFNMLSNALRSAAEKSSLSEHVDAYLDKMDERRAEARPGETIPPRYILQMAANSALSKFVSTDDREKSRDDLVKLTNKGNNKVEKDGDKVLIGGRNIDDVISDRLAGGMRGVAAELQKITDQSKSDELRLNRTEQLLGMPVTSFDRQVVPTNNAPIL